MALFAENRNILVKPAFFRRVCSRSRKITIFCSGFLALITNTDRQPERINWNEKNSAKKSITTDPV